MQWVYLLTAILGEVIATSALKPAEGFTRPIPAMIVVVGYAIAFFFLSLTLKTIPIGVTYAIWSGVGVVLISVVGVIFFKQHLDAPAIVGIALITIGVLVINIFSKSVVH